MLESNRRDFVKGLSGALLGFFILPSAKLFERRWVKVDSGLIVPEYVTYDFVLYDHWGMSIKTEKRVFHKEHTPDLAPDVNVIKSLQEFFVPKQEEKKTEDLEKGVKDGLAIFDNQVIIATR